MPNRAFEKLCLIASKKSWCWKLTCGTCGHFEFRRSWPLLARGYGPGSNDWTDAMALMDRDVPDDDPGSTSLLDQDALSRVMASARLEVIGGNCRFPDWLGYLGLGLHSTARVEATTRRLTKAWLPQLARMVRMAPLERPWAAPALDPEAILTFRLLEDIENRLQPQYRVIEPPARVRRPARNETE